jgi:hypothetical protein
LTLYRWSVLAFVNIETTLAKNFLMLNNFVCREYSGIRQKVLNIVRDQVR